MNYYERLGVDRGAEPDVIDAAYRAMMRRYHPDKYDGSNAEAERRSKEINEAYAALKDPNRRRSYDETLAPAAARRETPPREMPGNEHAQVERGVNWNKAAIAGAAIALIALLIWRLSPFPTNSVSSDAYVDNTMNFDMVASSRPTSYALRSNVVGASLVRLDQLPSVTPYGDRSDDYCGKFVAPSTPGGQTAAHLGWQVIKEVKYQNFDAVLVVRGFDPGTSGHCSAKDPNLAFFDGDRLVGVLFSKGQDSIGMNDVQIVGSRLRVWDDLSPVGQISLNGTNLTFDRITGSDDVCNGKYRVPVVFGQPYSQARRILASSGWTSQPNNSETFEGDRTSDYRLRFPEVESCSGTGYAYCNFVLNADEGVAKLSITTAGEDDDPAVINYDVSCDGRQE